MDSLKIELSVDINTDIERLMWLSKSLQHLTRIQKKGLLLLLIFLFIDTNGSRPVRYYANVARNKKQYFKLRHIHIFCNQDF